MPQEPISQPECKPSVIASGDYMARNDFNCSEALLNAANTAYGFAMDESTLRVASPFGGGMGREHACGALTGALMAIGRLRGHTVAHQDAELMALRDEFVRRFDAEFGSLDCGPIKKAHRSPTRGCAGVVERAARILETLIEETAGAAPAMSPDTGGTGGTAAAAIDLRCDRAVVGRYVLADDTDPFECRTPYIHPLLTTGGDELTNHRPWDHPWHKGLTMTLTSVTNADGRSTNFWGGNSFVRGLGYQKLDNVGRIEHRGWLDDHRHHLTWYDAAGTIVFEEERSVHLAHVDPVAGRWLLELRFELRNASGGELQIGSPTTAGRPDAGYGGLFWRGPRSFRGGSIRAAGGLTGPQVMGQKAAWLAFTGRHDGSGNTSTIAFFDHPDNPRYPTQWFVRNEDFAGVACAFMFDSVYTVPADGCLDLRYRVASIAGDPSAEQIAELQW